MFKRSGKGKPAKTPPPSRGRNGNVPSKSWRQKFARMLLERAVDTKYGKKFKLAWWEVEDPRYVMDEETYRLIEVSHMCNIVC